MDVEDPRDCSAQRQRGREEGQLRRTDPDDAGVNTQLTRSYPLTPTHSLLLTTPARHYSLPLLATTHYACSLLLTTPARYYSLRLLANIHFPCSLLLTTPATGLYHVVDGVLLLAATMGRRFGDACDDVRHDGSSNVGREHLVEVEASVYAD